MFTGKAYVTDDHDEGSFLSDNSFDQQRKAEEQRDKNQPYPRRTYLGMAELFPANWLESKVEYIITVRAKKIPPTSPEKPSTEQ